MLETLLITLAVMLMILGIIGCVLPGLPGPAFSYVALLIFQFTPDEYPFKWWVIGVFLPITVVMIILDFVGPAYATKKFGGTKYGIWGGIIGLFIGMFFMGPFGIIIGPLLGAILGDLIGGSEIQQAFRSGMGSFIGFVLVTGLKLAVSVFISVMLVLKVLDVYGTVLDPFNWFS